MAVTITPTTIPAEVLTWLSPVDRWRLEQLTPKALAALKRRPREDWPSFLFAMKMIGDDFCEGRHKRIVLVIAAKAMRAADLLQVLALDTDPGVRAAAGWGLLELAGTRKPRTQFQTVREAETFRKKWLQGKARAPFAGFRQGPPLAA